MIEVKSCILTIGRISMYTSKTVAETKGYKSRYLKRSKEPIVNNPCDSCLIISTCTVWCDEKKEYLWE
jgi:hypothetical protein